MNQPDRELLRRHEPVVRFTRGERFLPMRVHPYVEASSFWRQRAGEEAELVIPSGELNVAQLIEPRFDTHATIYFLRFIESPDLRQVLLYNQRHRQDADDRFVPGRGRLARVGYGSRFIDLLFSVTLLARGRVPGDTSAAAALEYQRILDGEPRYTYYGRVVRDQGWTILQYWYFYAFNNWRSGFFGVNDHEGDWEMVNLYLAPDDTETLQPVWVAYASHDFHGDDLRRHWDDPEIEKEGEHPVIYAGAGSHASYYRPGEYLTEIELPFLAPLARLTDDIQTRWQRFLGELQNDLTAGEAGTGFNVFRVPFVDYARGDGIAIGPGQARQWTPAMLDPVPKWVSDYRGLWGLYARDPIAGENAPAGPMYNRDGTVRRAWHDPLGWAGMDKVPPPLEARRRLEDRYRSLMLEQVELATEIAARSRDLTELGVVTTALEDATHLEAVYNRKIEQIDQITTEVSQRRAQLAENEAILKRLEAFQERLTNGQQTSLRGHIRRAHEPASVEELQASRLVEFWAAISVGLIMILFVGLALFYREQLILGLVAVISVIVFIESGFRRQLDQLINSIAIGLAVAATAVVVFEFFWEIVVIAILIAGGYILLENLRELRQ